MYVCACSAYKKMTEEHAPATHSNVVEWTVIIICSMNLVWGNEIFQLNLQQHKFKVLDQITSLYIQLIIGTEQPKQIAESTLLEGCFKIQVRHLPKI